eukprot:UN05146
MLIQYVYGGRVDNSFDTDCLHSLVSYLFNANIFGKGFALSEYCKDKSEHIAPGRLCYAAPKGMDEKHVQPAKIAEVGDDEARVVFLKTHTILDDKRIELSSHWVT